MYTYPYGSPPPYPMYPNGRQHNGGDPWQPISYRPFRGNWNPYLRSEGAKDYGPNPYVTDIHQAALQNGTFRTVLWTGKHLQVTLMSIHPGEDIGLEIHPQTDQFIRVEEGQALVRMGASKDQPDFEQMAYEGSAIMIPAGKWHNIINTGSTPLKVYAIYAPPQHPPGTVHPTKKDAMAAE